MKTSTHRIIQLRQLADSARALAQSNRRAACNAAGSGFKGAARMLSSKATKAEGVYRSACGRIARSGAGFNGISDL
jgi:hypothetical protein